MPNSWPLNMGELEELFGESGKYLAAVSVTNLPDNISERQLKYAVQRAVPVKAVHVTVDYETRRILNSCYIVVSSEHAVELDSGLRKVSLMGVLLVFRLTIVPVMDVLAMIAEKQKKRLHPREFEWPSDVRPGHPYYRLPRLTSKPLDLAPLDPEKASIHCLNDDVLFQVFALLDVICLIKVESTCRRWLLMVRMILGGRRFVNSMDPASPWNLTRSMEQEPHYSTLLVHKLLVLNWTSLQHLVLDGYLVHVENVRTAVKRCARRLTHFWYTELCKGRDERTRWRTVTDEGPWKGLRFEYTSRLFYVSIENKVRKTEDTDPIFCGYTGELEDQHRYKGVRFVEWHKFAVKPKLRSCPCLRYFVETFTSINSRNPWLFLQ